MRLWEFAGALLTNILVFRLEGIALLLWMLVAASVGIFGGLLGELLFQKIIRFAAILEIVA